MADGSIVIEIEGDASDLEKSLNDVAKAADKMSDSFGDAADEAEGMADAVDDVDEGGIDDAADAAETLGDSAGEAADEVGSVSDALDGVDGGGLDDASAAAETLGDSASGAAIEIDDVASTLDGVDGSGLDDAAGSADGLESSLSGVTGSVDEVSTSLESIDGSGLEDAASSADGLESSASGAASAVDALASSLSGVDGSGLDSAAGSAGNLSVGLTDILNGASQAIGGNALGGLSGVLSKIPFGATTMAAAGVAGAVAGVGIAVAKQVGNLAEYGDHIDKMSQKLGISSTAYQEWDAVLQHSGTSIDSFGAAFKTLSNAAADGSKQTEEAFRKLGFSMEEVKSMSKEDLFSAVITQLQQMEEGTERTAIGADLLGRGVMELGPLLNTSAEDTAKMKQTVHELGGVMSEDAVKGAAKFQDTLQDLKTNISGVWRSIGSELIPIGTVIMETISNYISKVKEILGPAIERLQEAFGKVKEAFSNILPEGTGASILNFLTEFVATVATIQLDALITALTLVCEGFAKVVEFGGRVVEFFQGLPGISTIAESVSQTVNGAFETMNTKASNAVKSAKESVSGAWDNIKTKTAGTYENVKKTVSDAWDNAKTKTSQAMENVKTTVGNAWENVKTTVSTKMENVKTTLSGAWESIKTTVTTKVNAVKSTVTTTFDAIKTAITTKIEAAKSTVTSVFDNIKRAITEKITAAKNTVTDMIEKIKGAFNFSWSLPHLKLPHISVTGGVAPFGIGGKGSLPKFSIAWYAKGGVMKNPTIFGMAGNTLLGGGEAGPEAIAPIKTLQKYINTAVSGSMERFVERMKKAVESETLAISSALGGRFGAGPGAENNYNGTTVNVYVDGCGADNQRKTRDIGREIGAETAREMRRRGLAPT